MSESNKKGLTPQGVNLAALLNAYDKTVAEIPSKDEELFRKKIISGEEKFEITPEQAMRERAVVRNMELRGVSKEESDKEIQVLLDTGLDFMVAELGQDETKKDIKS